MRQYALTLAISLACFMGTSHAGAPQFEFVRKIENPEPGPGDEFGVALAAEAGRLVVSAYRDDVGATDSGSAYVFDFDGELIASLSNPEPNEGAYFSERGAVISGDTMLIGAHLSDFGAHKAGSAYLYDLDGVLKRAVRNPDLGEREGFGFQSTAVPRGFLVYEDNDVDGFQDAATIWHLDEEGNILGAIPNPAPDTTRFFGWGVAKISDETFFASAGVRTAFRDEGVVESWIMSLDGEIIHEITNPSGDDTNAFGAVATTVGDSLVISAERENLVTGEALVPDSGFVYVFDFEGQLIASIPNPDAMPADWFGRSITPVGDDMFAVASVFNDRGAPDAGAVFLFSLDGELLQTIENPMPTANAHFGHGLAYSDGNLFVGAHFDGGFAGPGAVYQFQLVFPPLTADFNQDGVVDLNDFVILKDHFGRAGATPEQGDANGDGTIDLEDFNLLKEEFGSVSQAVPEPAGWTLMVGCVAAVAVLRKPNARGRAGEGRGRFADWARTPAC